MLDMDVGSTTKLVFIAIAMHADWKDLTCFPSQSELARICGLAKKQTVGKHIKILVEQGWLEYLGQRKVGKWKHNVYHIKKGVVPVKKHKKKKEVEMPDLTGKSEAYKKAFEGEW